ncbi:MAG: hypothetical protein ACREQ5_33840, partial [Candidatus Dormibacteria bacterium]
MATRARDSARSGAEAHPVRVNGAAGAVITQHGMPITIMGLRSSLARSPRSTPSGTPCASLGWWEAPSTAANDDRRRLVTRG